MLAPSTFDRGVVSDHGPYRTVRSSSVTSTCAVHGVTPTSASGQERTGEKAKPNRSTSCRYPAHGWVTPASERDADQHRLGLEDDAECRADAVPELPGPPDEVPGGGVPAIRHTERVLRRQRRG